MKSLTEKIDELKSLLSSEQLDKDILEIEHKSKNEKIIQFLEKVGAEEFVYETTAKIQLGKIQEKGGVAYLWYKKPDGIWIIKLWEINRIEK